MPNIKIIISSSLLIMMNLPTIKSVIFKHKNKCKYVITQPACKYSKDGNKKETEHGFLIMWTVWWADDVQYFYSVYELHTYSFMLIGAQITNPKYEQYNSDAYLSQHHF